MKLKKILKHTHAVRVINEPLEVSVSETAPFITAFASCDVAPFATATSSLDGIDLTGCSEYRLTLRLSGESGTPFSISEQYGPIGDTDQIRFTIATSCISQEGILDFRGTFALYAPDSLAIVVKNDGGAPLVVDGVIFAVK